MGKRLKSAKKIAEKALEETKALEKSLLKEVKLYNKEYTDIAHLIELGNLSASEGYKAYRRYHDLLNKRRDLKNQFQDLDLVAPKIFDSYFDLEELEKKREKRIYCPRVEPEIFVGKNIEGKIALPKSPGIIIPGTNQRFPGINAKAEKLMKNSDKILNFFNGKIITASGRLGSQTFYSIEDAIEFFKSINTNIYKNAKSTTHLTIANKIIYACQMNQPYGGFNWKVETV